jgi:adenylate kinase
LGRRLYKRERLLYIILLGPPGAGKGTQAAYVARKLGLVHVSSGDLFRQALERGDDLAREVKSYMEQGALVPDELTVRMVLERLEAPDGAAGVVLDGFPRNLKQAKALDESLTKRGKAIDGVVSIRVSNQEILRRLGGRWVCRDCQAPYHATDSPPKVSGKCDRCGGELYQRPDDNVETIKKRLTVYTKETAPLTDYYAKRGKLIEVDGEGSAESVGERIITALKRD